VVEAADEIDNTAFAAGDPADFVARANDDDDDGSEDAWSLTGRE
jgi:hypothetical protein